MAYWLISASIARQAASLSSDGAAKSGKPCARLTASCAMAKRVISRMTDSVKEAARREISLIGLSSQQLQQLVVDQAVARQYLRIGPARRPLEVRHATPGGGHDHVRSGHVPRRHAVLHHG